MKSDDSTTVRSYAVHRHQMLTAGCQCAEGLNLSPTRQSSTGDVSAQDGFDSYSRVLGITFPFEVLTWFRDHALGVHREVRTLRTMQGHASMVGIEHLVERDLLNLTMAVEFRNSLGLEVQAAAESGCARDWSSALEPDAARLALTVPPVVLMAWQKEWTDALRVLHDLFGGDVAPDPSLVEGLIARLDAVEEEGRDVRARLHAASAVFQQPPAPAPEG